MRGQQQNLPGLVCRIQVWKTGTMAAVMVQIMMMTVMIERVRDTVMMETGCSTEDIVMHPPTISVIIIMMIVRTILMKDMAHPII